MNRAQRAASLDELVAVKVMGDERRSGGAPPAYSTDMRHAWAVIRRLREMGWEHDLMVVADKHVVRFSRDGESVMSGAETMPKATCLAALLAVGEGPV